MVEKWFKALSTKQEERLYHWWGTLGWTRLPSLCLKFFKAASPERTANCSLTLENKNQTHLRVQWVVFLAFLLSQSDLESSVSSTLSSPPRIDSPSGRIFFCFSFCFQEGKGQGKSVPPKKIALNSKAYRGNWCHWWSASFPAMLRDLLAFLGLLWSHFGSFWYLLLKPSDTSLLEVFLYLLSMRVRNIPEQKLNRSPEYSIGLGSGPKNKYIKVWSCLGVSRRIWRSIALMNLSLSIYLSVYPSTHPSISLPPSLALSLSLLSLSLWMPHLMSNPRLICLQEVTLMCQISTHD